MVKELGKIPRNFGEKGTPAVKAHAAGSGGVAQTSEKRLFTKTQVRAKSQDDVYGLTPARCWKVKGPVNPSG